MMSPRKVLILHCVCLQRGCTVEVNQLTVQVSSTFTFCEFTARLRWAKSEEGSTVPRKMDLYWFIPALAKSRVGSECGTTDEEGTVFEISTNIKSIRSIPLTKSMSIFLEEINESIPDTHSGPLLRRTHPNHLLADKSCSGRVAQGKRRPCVESARKRVTQSSATLSHLHSSHQASAEPTKI